MSTSSERIYEAKDNILVVDYTGCKEDQLIVVASALKEHIAAKKDPVLVLTIFDDRTFITPRFMRHAERETKEVLHLVKKVAFIGLSPTKKIILNGYNYIIQRNFQAFNTREEAITYLLDGSL